MRSSGKLLFPQLRDGTGVVQCVVVKNSIAPEVWDALKPLGQESALIVHGVSAKMRGRPAALRSTCINAEVVQEVHDYPITPKEHGTGVSDGSSPPVAAFAAAARDS